MTEDYVEFGGRGATISAAAAASPAADPGTGERWSG
jgi:hypothetical protein